jgi:hypothetical protein
MTKDEQEIFEIERTIAAHCTRVDGIISVGAHQYERHEIAIEVLNVADRLKELATKLYALTKPNN